MSCECSPPFIGPSLDNICGTGSFVVFMSILNTFITNQCSISELCSRVSNHAQPNSEYDFVVIGGGSAGAVVASRLSEVENWNVLLVEAGGDEPPGTQVPAMMGSNLGLAQLNWGYQTEPESSACLSTTDHRCNWIRGKVLGGCSVLHGMMYMRGIRKDYDGWRDAGNERWGYEDVLPYFIKSEDNQEIGSLVQAEYHGRGGYMTISRFPHQPDILSDIQDAAAQLGYPIVNDLNGANITGFSIVQATVRNGARLSSARAFLRPDNVRRRSNLHIMLNSTVTKLIFKTSNDTKSIQAVEISSNGTKYTVNVLREAILSAGAINSPHLLLLSGIGPKKVLDDVGVKQIHELPGVGENLHNHVSFSVIFDLLQRNNSFDLDWPAIVNYLLNNNGPMSSTGMAQFTGRLNTKYADPDGKNPDVQIFFGGYAADCTNNGVVGALQSSEAKRISLTATNLHPKSRGRIYLNSSDASVPPMMIGNYFSDPIDIDVIIDGIRISQRLANSTILKEKYGIQLANMTYGTCANEFEFDSDEYWKCAVRYQTNPENHQAGSCKMGPRNDTNAVVDPKLQVYGIEGLRVIDASVIPKWVSGNIYAPIVMIAERGSDFIKEKWNATILNNTLVTKIGS